MLVYEKLGEGGSGNIDILQKSPDIPKDITDKLEKLGFQMDSETFGRIRGADQQEIFIQDLSAAVINPAEKGRIEQLYLKGFGQVIDTPYGPLSFVEIQKHPKKDEILSGLKPSKQAKFNEWEQEAANQRIDEKKGVEQAANQEEKKIDTNIQAANQSNEWTEKRLSELNTQLQSSTDTIRSLSSLPQGIEARAIESAKQNPPKELAGVPPEQYSKYTNLILADYTISNANEIKRSLRAEDREKFGQSITEIGKTLGRTPENWPEIVETKGGLVLGERREEIRTLGEKYIRDGYNESVVWDSQSRSLVFRGRDGEKIIDTAPVPPQERIEQAGLSISRDVAPIRLSQTEVSHQKLDRGILSTLDGMSQSQTTRGRIDPVAQTSIDESFEEARSYPDTKDKLASTYKALGIKKNALEKSTIEKQENGEIAEANALTGDSEQVERQIKQVEEMARQYEKSLVDREREAGDAQDDNFDSIARTNLSWLTSPDSLFQRMGPSGNRAIARIITLINKDRDRNNQINLATKELDIPEKNLLKEKYEKLGGTLSTLKDGESIRAFQIKIAAAAEKPVGAPESIEWLLDQREESSEKNNR